MQLISSWEEEFTVNAFLKGMSAKKKKKVCLRLNMKRNKIKSWSLLSGVIEWNMWLTRKEASTSQQT